MSAMYSQTFQKINMNNTHTHVHTHVHTHKDLASVIPVFKNPKTKSNINFVSNS